jgi:hypothetical protein
MALTDNLQAFYKLSDLSDSSGNNKTLTNNGNVSFASGKIGNAGVFDTTNWLDCAPFNAPDDFSVSFWGSAVYDGDNGAIFVNQYPGLYIATRNDGSVTFGDMSSWESNSLAGVVTANAWYHYCLVRNGGTANLYINNVLATSSSENLPDLTNDGRNFGFFGNPEDGHVWDSGSIDAVGIWNRALSDAEVAELYNNGTGLELDGVPQPTLVKLQAPVKFMGKVKFGV